VRVVREHREAARPLVTEFGGRIVKTVGDGVLLEFPSAVAAVDARGNGMLDWEVDQISLDAWVSDFETVVDALAWIASPFLGFLRVALSPSPMQRAIRKG
jgi:class 3 adenylate cyclase